MSKSYRVPSRDFKPLRFDLTERRVRQPELDELEEAQDAAENVDTGVLDAEPGEDMDTGADAATGAKKWSF